MPDDCGYLEEYYNNSLRNMQTNTGTYIKHSRVCPYCRTDHKRGGLCINCGAPQEESISRIPPVSLF